MWKNSNKTAHPSKSLPGSVGRALVLLRREASSFFRLRLVGLPQITPVKPPVCLVIAGKFLVCQHRPNHFDRDAVFMKQRVVELAVGHLSGIDQVMMKRILL